jgi:uncharacterized FlaG/YvyC family protein
MAMNIKSIANNLIPFDVKKITRTRAEASSDRDADGKREDSPKKQPRRNLSEEELSAAINYLKELKGVKDHNLNVRLGRENGVPVALIEDNKGKIVRRIPETELSMLDTNEKSKGNLLDKSL